MNRHVKEIFSEEEWESLIEELELTPKQGKVVRALFDGLSDKEMMRRLNIALPTVRSHLKDIRHKLNIPNRALIVLQVFRKFRENSDGEQGY